MPLGLLGLDSLSTIEMAAALEEAFGCELPDDVMVGGTSARALAARISSLRSAPAPLVDDPFEQMLADAVLPDDVRPVRAAGAPTDLRQARRILLTGATGFLGGALLAELLGQRGVEIVCLVRRPRQSTDDRVRYITGDLSHPWLGLGQMRFKALAGTVDAVLHCGASVNWVSRYAGLRAANVLGTLELLRLACRRGIPFHFVSSLSVCYPADGPARVEEAFDALPHLRAVHLGYAQSKVVGEALVREAGARGLPVRIYRPALISGHRSTGVFNHDDMITALVRGCVAMGTAPELDWQLDCQPVDFVARAIVDLSSAAGCTFHLGHPRPRHWREIVLWMRLYGYPIRLIPYHAWLRQLDAETARPDATAHPLRPLRAFFLTRHADARSLTLPELYEDCRRTAASSAATLAELAERGLTPPALDADLLNLYFDRFISSGALPPAPQSIEVALSETTGGATGACEPASALARCCSVLSPWRLIPLQADSSGAEASIVSELTAWRSRRQTGIFRARAELPDGTSRLVRLKAKAADTDAIAVGEALAGLVDPAVGAAYARWRDRLGFTASHVREIEIYRQTDSRFLRHSPALLGSVADAGSGTWLLALEEISGAQLLDTANTSGAWTAPDIQVAIDGLAALQAIWFDREAELRRQPWIGYVQSATGMAEMTDLWTAVADHAVPAFSSWADPDMGSLQRRLIAALPAWWRDLEAGPRTLIHHDFNPRNICLRDGRLCAYDWELATIGAPQRDLAEFLCFVLPPEPEAADVQGWIDRHRAALERETGGAIDAAAWQRGFRAALYDVLVNRLSIYALVHRVRPQRFLPRVVRTWRGLYEHFPLEEHA